MFDKEPGEIWQAEVQDEWRKLMPDVAVMVRCSEHRRKLLRVEVAGADAMVVAMTNVGTDDQARVMARQDRAMLGSRRVAQSGTGTKLAHWWLEHAPDDLGAWCPKCEQTRPVHPDRLVAALGTWVAERKRDGTVGISC